MIDPEMRIKDLIVKYPRTKKVIAHYGLSNIGCGWGGKCKNTIQQVVESKKLDMKKIMDELNESLIDKERPKR